MSDIKSKPKQESVRFAKHEFMNPFRPGAGHMPPYFAGRASETRDFEKLLSQTVVTDNLVITGLRGIGKTALLESFKPIANSQGWLWAGTDCSESVSVDENTMALRIITDIAILTSGIKVNERISQKIGFSSTQSLSSDYMDFNYLVNLYETIPGLPSDKLKSLLLNVWQHLSQHKGVSGMILAYDEVQTLSDQPDKQQYPLSLLLDVIQSLQKRGVCCLLVLTGLPQLLTRLIQARTYSERLFRVLSLDRLTDNESRDAITRPLSDTRCHVKFDSDSVDLIVAQSGGYPYFIQFLCREAYDAFQQQAASESRLSFPLEAITRRLDNDFFAGRWSRASEREKELLSIVAANDLETFSLKQLVELSTSSEFKSMGNSQANQLLKKLIEHGLVYKTRRGEYSFAVPLLGSYIRRNFISG